MEQEPIYFQSASCRSRLHLRGGVAAGIILLLAGFQSACAFGQSLPEPPRAEQKDHVSDWHGSRVNDPFFWLREKSNPEVRKYLEAENAYTEAMTAELKPFADALYKE